jgi:hypothetical protein
MPRKEDRMIDRAARDGAATLIRRFMAGRVTNDDLDSGFPQSRIDPALDALAGASWYLYGDDSTYRLPSRNAFPRDARRQVSRWVLFLHSGLEYEWPDFNWYAGVPTPSPLLDWLTCGALTRLKARREAEIAAFQAAGDYAAWPFFREADVRRALQRPRLLKGCPPLEPAAASG